MDAIKNYRNLAVSKQPKNDSFKTVARHCNDKLMIAKFKVFVAITGILSESLKVYTISTMLINKIVRKHFGGVKYSK